MIPTPRALGRLGSLAMIAASLAACTGKAGDGAAASADSTAHGASAASGATSADRPMAGVNVDASMAGMPRSSGTAGSAGTASTGNADHDFLRMMSDHHKGLTVMAHGAKEMKLPVAADAKKLDTKQDGELDRMMTMLETQYKDPYTPKITAGNQAMIDALKGKTGDDYQKTFYLDVVQHHQEAIKMIDGYLATAKDPVVKAMAEKMKADQTKEIAEFQRKAATS
jgi:uncharacterized protein (DUF305 family)